MYLYISFLYNIVLAMGRKKNTVLRSGGKTSSVFQVRYHQVYKTLCDVMSNWSKVHYTVIFILLLHRKE